MANPYSSVTSAFTLPQANLPQQDTPSSWRTAIGGFQNAWDELPLNQTIDAISGKGDWNDALGSTAKYALMGAFAPIIDTLKGSWDALHGNKRAKKHAANVAQTQASQGLASTYDDAKAMYDKVMSDSLTQMIDPLKGKYEYAATQKLHDTLEQYGLGGTTYAARRNEAMQNALRAAQQKLDQRHMTYSQMQPNFFDRATYEQHAGEAAQAGRWKSTQFSPHLAQKHFNDALNPKLQERGENWAKALHQGEGLASVDLSNTLGSVFATPAGTSPGSASPQRGSQPTASGYVPGLADSARTKPSAPSLGKTTGGIR